MPIDLLFGLQHLGEPAPADVSHAFCSWSYEWVEPVERAVVLGLLCSAGLLRAKGIVRFADAPALQSVIHRVGNRLDVSDGEPWRDGETSRLVLIGLGPMLGSLPKERTTWRAG